MSTRRQIAAYREILHQRQQDHLRKQFGMVPIKARFLGTCGCGRIFDANSGWPAGTPCRFGQGDLIVRFRGKWTNMTCADRIQQDEFKASARFVLEEVFNLKSGTRYHPKAWTNDPAEAERWRRLAAENAELNPDYPEERLVDRQETANVRL